MRFTPAPADPRVEIFKSRESDGGVAETEIWIDARTLQGAYRRGNTYQSLLARLETRDSYDAFRDWLTSNPQLNVSIRRENEYYATQSQALTRLIRTIGFGIAALMGIGAVFGAEKVSASVEDGNRKPIWIVARSIEHAIGSIGMLPKRHCPSLRQSWIVGSGTEASIGVEQRRPLLDPGGEALVAGAGVEHAPFRARVLVLPAQVREACKKHWGELATASNESLRAEVEKMLQVVAAGSGNPYTGKKLYATSCGKCHKLFADGGAICGLLFEKLPGADTRDPDGWNRVTQLAATLGLAETVNVQPYDILVKLFPEELLRVFRLYPVEYHCPWNPASVERVLRSLGRPEIESILDLPHLRVLGLMTMPPLETEPEGAREYFRRLRSLRDLLAARFPQARWHELSMGTSADYPVAVEEGATLVRVGTAIVGARKYSQPG